MFSLSFWRIFSYRNVACDLSYNWQLENHKSDTVRGRYELFTAGCCSCRWMSSCCNHFRVFFISLASSSQNRIFSYQNLACDIPLIGNCKLTNLIQYEAAMRFLQEVVALVADWLFAATTFVLLSSLWPRLLKIGSFHIKA
jgi:hypothetical protein